MPRPASAAGRLTASAAICIGALDWPTVKPEGGTVATGEDDGLPYDILLLALGARARER